MNRIFTSPSIMKYFFLVASLCAISFFSNGQSYHYVKGTFDITIKGINPCGSPAPNNGSLTITVNAANGGSAFLIFLDGPGSNDDFGQSINVGATYTFNSSGTLPPGDYNFIIRDQANTATINTFSDVAYPKITLTAISGVSLSQDVLTNNTSCVSPLTGQIQSTISGGSQTLGAGLGSYTYSWSSSNGLAGLPLTGTTDGTTPLDLATLLGLPGLPGGTYNLVVADNFSTCSNNRGFTITDPSPATQIIANPSPTQICSGDNITITLNNTEAGVNYAILKNGIAAGFSFVGTGTGPFPMTFSSASFVDGDVIQIRATAGICSPNTFPQNVVLQINPLPVLVTPQAKTICGGNNTAYEILLTPANFPAGTLFNWPDPDGAGPATAGVNVPMGVAGTTHINDVLSNVTGAPITVNYVITPTSGLGCFGTPQTVAITVNPTPVLVIGQAKTICGGDNVAYEILLNPVNQPVGTVFNWPDPDGAGPATAGVNVPMGVAGTTHINDILTNVTGTAITINYVVTPTSGSGCPGTPQTVAITVSPLPVLVTSQAKTICSGSSVAYEILLNPVNQPVGTVFNWPDPDGAGPATAGVNVPMGVAGTTHINDVLTNLTGAPISVIYAVTPSVGSCVGTPQNVTITINPAPVLITPQAKTICSGDNVAYEILLTPANLPAGTLFSWPDPDGAGPATAGVNVPMGAAGTTHINDILTNITGTAITVNYVVTPTSGSGCPGTPQTVAITVSPIPVLVASQTKTICSGNNVAYEILLTPANLPAGTLFNWPDPDGAGPATAGVNVPMGVAGTTHINDVLTNLTGAPISVIYAVTPSVGSCVGTPQNVTITINPAPVLITPQAKTICSGDNVAYEILLTPANLPAGTLFSWPDPDGAGPATAGVNVPMGAAGTTHINDVLTNVTGAAITVNYVITPTSGSGCPGIPQTVAITVNPAPVLVASQTKTICSGDNVAYEILLTPANLPAGTLFSWPDPDGAGPATAGVNVPMGVAGTIHINDVLTNATVLPITVNYVVTPTSGSGCAGAPQTIAIIVSPRPVLVTPQTKTICSGDNVAYEILLTPANLPAGTLFSWPDPDGAGPATAGVNVPMGAAGTTHINDVLTNVTGAAITVNYVITPTSGSGCPGTPQTVAITVNPAPVLVASQTKTICSGDNVAYEILLTPANLPAGTLFSWPDPDGAGPATAGVNVPMGVAGTIHINDVLTNATALPITVNYVVTPTSGSGCAGAPQTIAIIVSPRPVLVTPQTKTICSGDNVAYEILLTPANLPAGTLFSWPDPDGAGPATAGVNVPTGAAGTTHINDVLTNTTGSPITVTYTITPSVGGTCTGVSQDITITVNPAPVLVASQTKTICSGDNVAYEILLTPANLPAGTLFNWPDPDGAGPATAGVNVPMGIAGTIHINDVLTNATASPLTVNYVITPTSGPGCAGAPQTIAIIVSPRPVLVTPQTKTICSGDNVAYEILLNPANQPAGTVFNWADPDGGGPATAGVNVPTGVAGTIHINDVLINSTAVPISVTYVVTPSIGGTCVGTPESIIITINPASNAGSDKSVTACNTDNSFNLLASLGGSPDPGGTWTDLSTSGAVITGNTADFTSVAPGSYSYQYTVVGASPCPNATAILTVTIINGTPDAGSDSPVNGCNSDAAFNLFTSLGGTPDPGGAWTDVDASGAVITGDNIDLTSLSPGVYHYQYTVTVTGCGTASSVVTLTVINGPNAGADNAVTACSSDTAFDLFNSLGGTPTNGGTWTDLDASGATIIGNVADFTGVTTTGVYRYQYTVAGTSPCPNATAILTVTITVAPNAGLDQSTTACNNNNSFNLLANLGGTPTTGGTWTDINSSGGVITGNVIDLTTVAVGSFNFLYTVNGSGACANATATLTLNVINTTPDAGSDNTVTGCDSDPAFDLFTSLVGSPDPGGTWTDLDGSGATITGNTVNLLGLGAGPFRYQYTLAVSGCGGASAIVTVNVVPGPNAGLDKPATACNSNNSFNLLAGLGGTPTNGGTWTDVDTSGATITGNTADFTTVAAGVFHYQYTVTGTAPCTSASSILTVTVSNAANSGAPATVQACTSDAAFDLFTNLSGTPDAGGTWTDLDGTGAVITGNIIDFTTITTAGLYHYQYTVTGSGPCSNAQTTLTVDLKRAPKAGAAATVSACNSATAFDLLASLSGTPDTGGTWTDLDGSTAVITGNNADLTTVAAGTFHYQYTVTGTAPCANATAILTINITPAPSVANAGPDQVICGTVLTTLAANTPTVGSGIWTAVPSSGAVLTPNSPTSQFVGNLGTSYTLKWIITSGSCTPSTDDVIINFSAPPTSATPVTACVNGSAPTLSATATGATAIKWYTDAALTNLVFTGSNYTPAAAQLNLSTVATTSFYVTADYSCGTSTAAKVDVNVSNTGVCGGGGGGTVNNCLVFAASDPVIEIRPSCSNQNDGKLTFGVKGGSGSYIVTLYDSVATPIFTQAKIGSSATPITFTFLSPSDNYFYKIEDGVNVCVLPYSLPVTTTVKATASNFTNVTCFGDSTGTAKIVVTGGNSPYEYSIDGGANWTTGFVSGNVITGLPPNGTYNILVRDDALDLCPAETAVTINNANPRIKSTFTISPATCGNSDGAITAITASGGVGSGYQFSIDGISFKSANSFPNIAGGVYTLSIKDQLGCIKDTTANVTFPGFVSFTVSNTPADCINNGKSGKLSLTFTNPGTYTVGISLDPLVPAKTKTYTTNNPSVDVPLMFDSLARGTYYLFAKGTGSACATIQGPFIINGVYALSFNATAACNGNKLPSLRLSNITYDPTAPIEFTVIKRSTNSIEFDTTVVSPTNNSLYLNFATHAFLQSPNEYQITSTQIGSSFCQITSDPVNYIVSPPLIAYLGPITKSYPDYPTGSLQVINFSGGLPPYHITLMQDSVFGLVYDSTTQLVGKNLNLQYEVDYKNIPAGRYQALVKDSAGCVIDLVARVPLDQSIFIPNIFTPNGDSYNDTFFIRNLPNGGANIVITNRWGKEVFTSNDYKNNWDGGGVSDGIYFYLLKIEGSSALTGWVEIARGDKP